MGTVDLELAAVRDDCFAFTRVDEAAKHVDVPVKNVVLRVLMNAGNAFFDEHHGNIRASYTRYIRVKVDRPANFIFNEIQCSARRATLFARHRNAPNALCRPLKQGVNM